MFKEKVAKGFEMWVLENFPKDWKKAVIFSVSKALIYFGI